MIKSGNRHVCKFFQHNLLFLKPSSLTTSVKDCFELTGIYVCVQYIMPPEGIPKLYPLANH